MLRSILAVIVGYLAVAIIVMVTTMAAAAALIPGAMAAMRTRQRPTPTPAYLVANLACGFLAAVVGGYVAGVIAIVSPFAHAAALAALFAVVSLASSRGGRAELGQPAWYPLTILGIGVAGVLVGGWVRLLVVAPGLPLSP